MIDVKTAIILAAGKGKKMWPYNDYWPKAALPVANQGNIVHLVNHLKSLSFDRIIIVTSYLGRRIKSLVCDFEGVETIELSVTEGTADSLEKVVSLVNDEHLLIMYGDIFITLERLTSFVDAYQKELNTVDTLILSKPITNEFAPDWFGISKGTGNSVQNIYGHPRPHYVQERLIGVFALSTKALKRMLHHNPGFMKNVPTGVMPQHEMEFEQSLQWLVEEGYTVSSYPLTDGVIDIDKPWHLMQANQLALSVMTNKLQHNDIPETCNIHPTADIQGCIKLGEHVEIGKYVTIKGNAIIGDHTKIENGVTIEGNVVIGSHCRIENFCRIGPDSVIGSKNRIGHCAEFSGITFDNVSFIHFGEVFGIIGESTDIAAGVTVGITRFDDLPQTQKVNGRREIPEKFGNAVYFGDFTRTGILSLYMPGTKVGSNCVIGSGVAVEKDIPSKTLLYAQQTLIEKGWDTHRYGW